ncbi:unnamed protein product [Heterosigma akashiwo]
MPFPADQQALLQRTHDRIWALCGCPDGFLQPMETDIPDGRAGYKVDPVNVAGCYVLADGVPASHRRVLMTAVTACRKPQGGGGLPAAAHHAGRAHVAGADLFLAVGGAQSIAAMASGAGARPRDIIVAQGNKWVTDQKSLVAGRVGSICSPGPRRCL